MMTVVFMAFLFLAAALWTSVFGYFLVLGLMILRRRRKKSWRNSLPEIAVIIPVLNEDKLILPKLEDLGRSDYPPEKMTILVIDGGSLDGTSELVKRKAVDDPRVRYVSLEKAGSKAAQVAGAFELIDREFVVVTDADSRLEPSCIRELIEVLNNDPQTAVVGAKVEPCSALAEERIHWWFMNHIWWLEGEALSSGGLSGVCYACRRSFILKCPREARAEDVHLALCAGAFGMKSRICLAARAFELRVPQNLQEIFRFRRRRGSVYLSEVLRAGKSLRTPFVRRFARAMKLWHFIAVPRLSVVLVAAGALLMATEYRLWPIVVFLITYGSVLSLLVFSPLLIGEKWRMWKMALAVGRLFALTLGSMLALDFNPPRQGPRGGRS